MHFQHLEVGDYFKVSNPFDETIYVKMNCRIARAFLRRTVDDYVLVADPYDVYDTAHSASFNHVTPVDVKYSFHITES